MNAKLIKKIDVKTTEMEKKARKMGRKLKVLAVIMGILVSIGAVFLTFYNVSKWYDENRVVFQNPVIIKFQSPVKVEKRKQNTQKQAPESVQGVVIAEEVPTQPNLFEQAYDYVWLRESNRGNDKTGLNGYCLARGELNEIGFAPHENYCFKDREEQHAMFILWLNNRLNHIKMPYCNDIDGCLRVYSNNDYGFDQAK